MLMIPLQSGSNGNCIYVEAGDVRLLFDAGLSARQAEQRLAAYGRTLHGVDGLFISHEHGDHVRFAGSLARTFKIPLFMTPRTFKAAARRYDLAAGVYTNHFAAGSKVQLGSVVVETLATPHDAVDGVVFVVDDGQCRLGICTDFGHVYGELEALVRSVDGLYLESNYDEQMLDAGPYPAVLKRRISGPRGHISNADAAALLAVTTGLQWACLAHLSEKNNAPTLALQTHRARLGPEFKLTVARRYAATPPLTLKPGLCRVVAPALAGLELDPDLLAFWGQPAPARVRSRLPVAPGGFNF